jgi:glycosyltransferase involved in cell wall biosynthesis
MWQGSRVSVILPAFNEEANVAEAVADFERCEYVDEIVVVDNNSTDGTAARVASTTARLVRETRQGLGWALRRGLEEASGDYLILAEPDGTFLARDALKLLAYAEDFNVVLGTRTTRELLWSEANMGWFLRLGNILVAKLLEILFGGPSLSDCGCTLRLIDRAALTKIKPYLSVGGSHFLVDMTICALAQRLSVIEIPVNYRGRVGVSKITGTLRGTFVTGGRMLALIVGRRLRPRHGMTR